MMSALITSSGIPEMTIIVSGQNASQSAMVDCNDGTQCKILCNYDSCSGLNVYCYGATCTFGVGLHTTTFTEIDCITNSGQYVVTYSGEVVLCPIVEGLWMDRYLDFDDSEEIESDVLHQHAMMNGMQLYNSGDCYAERECVGQIFDGGNWAFCFGFEACSHASFSDVVGVQCHGVKACADALFSGGSAVCNGRESCISMIYGYGSDLSVRCGGKTSCKGWTRDSSWEGVDLSVTNASISFQCSGYKSCKDAEMVNVEMCSGANSCENIVISTTTNI